MSRLWKHVNEARTERQTNGNYWIIGGAVTDLVHGYVELILDVPPDLLDWLLSVPKPAPRMLT